MLDGAAVTNVQKRIALLQKLIAGALPEGETTSLTRIITFHIPFSRP
jgi:hypothetical protein